MSGLFDELVQNEVNLAHNRFAQEKDELPVSNNLLVERRTARSPGVFIPSRDGGMAGKPTRTPEEINARNQKANVRGRGKMAKNAAEVGKVADAVARDALDKKALATIEFKDSVVDRVDRVRGILDKIKAAVTSLSTQFDVSNRFQSRKGQRVETAETINDLLAELKQYSPEEAVRISAELGLDEATQCKCGKCMWCKPGEKPKPKPKKAVKEGLDDIVDQLI